MKNRYSNVLLGLLLTFVSLKGEVLTPFSLYELISNNSNEIKSTQLQLESKKEDIEQIWSKLYPQVNASIDMNKVNYEINKLQNPSDKLKSEDSLDYTLRVTQSLFDYETYTKLGLEETRYELSEFQTKSNIDDILQKALTSYFKTLDSKNKIDLLKVKVKLTEQQLNTLQKRFEMKLTDKMELLKAQVEYNRSKIDLEKEKKIFQSYFTSLKKYVELDDIVLPSLDVEKFNVNSFDTLLFITNKEEMLNKNLTYLHAKKAIDLTSAEIDNAKSAFFPKLDLSAQYTKYVSDDITTDYENLSRVIVSLKIPLYQGGATYSKVQSMKLRNKASYEDLEATKKELDLAFDETLAMIEASLQSMKIYEDAYESSKTYLEFIKIGFENGLKSTTDLLDAEYKMYEIRYEFVQNIQEFMGYYVEYLMMVHSLEDLKKIDQAIF